VWRVWWVWVDELFVPALWERVWWKEGAGMHDWLEQRRRLCLAWSLLQLMHRALGGV
jgi:hypothetical protein